MTQSLSQILGAVQVSALGTTQLRDGWGNHRLEAGQRWHQIQQFKMPPSVLDHLGGFADTPLLGSCHDY